MTTTDEVYGKEEKFITTKLAPTSYLTTPVWEDGPKVNSVESVLFVKIISG